MGCKANQLAASLAVKIGNKKLNSMATTAIAIR